MRAVDDLSDRRGPLEEAIALVRDAIRARPSAPLHHRLGMLLAQQGEFDAAASAYRAAVRLQPDLADAWFQLGNVLSLQRRAAEAIAAYRRAVAAHGGFAAAHNNLGLVLQAEGRWEEALAAYQAACGIDTHPQMRANLARCLVQMPRVRSDAATRALLARALAEAWMRPADLARLAIAMLRAHPVLGPAIERACAAWPERLPASTFPGETVLQACAAEPLFAALLENAHASDRDLERFLTTARHTLLEAACEADGAAVHAEAALPFACALARQCFLNDYVFATTPAEAASVATLEQRVASSLASGSVAGLQLAVLACYRPLGTLRGADTLLERPQTDVLRKVLVQQVAECAEEAAAREALVALTPIAGDVSQKVRQQYEESPYPRWTRIPAGGALPLDVYLRQLFPEAALPRPGTIADRDILVAGCGTGQEPLDLARHYPESRILAVDLSRASLAYAARKTREAGCTNVEYAQADLLELGTLERRFDLISCMGVLHHLSDPLAGWRVLASLLRPGGFMQVGLYSALARREITAARAMIAARGWTPAQIRECRQEMLADATWDTVSSLRDFYGLNECRDLLFHVQEHCTTLPALRDTVAALGLRFVGLATLPDVAQRFAHRFPGASHGDLDLWHAFEGENPATFAGMYIFWVQKPLT